MQDNQNESKEAQETEKPRQNRPRARCIAEETGRDRDQPRFNGRCELAS
jgi:hypothetical protein